MLSRRRFFGTAAVAVGTAGLARAAGSADEIKPGSVPSLTAPFRLGVEWYRGAVKRFQAKLAERGLSGAIVTDVLNRNYLTGIFLTETERPNFLFVPAKGEPVAFIPGLDRDMATSWWVKDIEWYFDFPHAGEYSKHTWTAGPREDLFVWMLKGVAKRGYGSGKIGMDREPTPSVAT